MKIYNVVIAEYVENDNDITTHCASYSTYDKAKESLSNVIKGYKESFGDNVACSTYSNFMAIITFKDSKDFVSINIYENEVK